MLAGAASLSSGAELYSLKAGMARRTHDLPMEVNKNSIVQTYYKPTSTSDQCSGEEAGTILAFGGYDKATQATTDKILAFSFQHGWLETQTKLPNLQMTDIKALVIP